MKPGACPTLEETRPQAGASLSLHQKQRNNNGHTPRDPRSNPPGQGVARDSRTPPREHKGQQDRTVMQVQTLAATMGIGCHLHQL